MMLSPHFDLRELVPESVYTRYGASAQTFLDPRLIQALEWLRTKTGWRLKANDWHTGGHFQNRGFRLPDSTVGATLSQHKFGRAVDLSSIDATTKQLYDVILENQSEALANNLTTIEAIEATPTWVHISCQWNPPGNKILIIHP
jgi:hypothetical protein